MTSPKSLALAKRNSESALMPPPPTPKRQKRPTKVLNEDVYSDAISHIIARDFFPGLIETEAQKEYLDALDSNDKGWIREAGRNLTQVMTPRPESHRRAGRGISFTPRNSTVIGETPRNFVGETPGRTPVDTDHFAPEEGPKVDVNMSLAAFQSKYTSEDNESFNALLDKQNEKRAAKYGFFHHGNKIPTPRQLAWREKEQKRLESVQRTSNSLVSTNTARYQARPVALEGPSEDLNARPASVDSFPTRQGPRNHFMFGPEGVEDLVLNRMQNDKEVSRAPPKAVNYMGTRFSPAAKASEISVPPSPSMSAVDAAISGRSKPTESETGYSGAESPRVNGYAFVDAEPTPSELGVPVNDEDADAAEKEAVKQFLPSVDESGPSPFSIKERSKREDIHHKLVEKADMGRRKGSKLDQLRELGITPGRPSTPGSKTARRAGMTPAAQSLAGRLAIPGRTSNTIDFDRTNRGSWTPTPRIRRAGKDD